jgi:hypothetical protein
MLITAAVLAASPATGVAPAASPSAPLTTVVTFRGSYVLNSSAGQPSFEPTSPGCVPGSRQHETESVSWTIRFTGPAMAKDGSVTLRQQSAMVSGTHVWDERSLACAAYPSGHLVCRTHFVPGQSELEVQVTGKKWTFHPRLSLVAVSDGCTGKVYNEHPDCGARDAAAITDFAFLSRLRREAPRLDSSYRIAPFDVHRAATCAQRGPKAQPGDRNTGLIRQHSVARYRGTFTVHV